MKTPNLFRFATGELSQDAFICWLLDWGNPSNEAANPSLHQLGREFLVAILSKANVSIPDTIDSVEVIQQQDKIDVVAVVNESIVVLIEDKTGTSDHSGQLLRYKQAAETRYPEHQIVPVYYKIQDQFDFDRIRELEYSCFLRADILPFFHDRVELFKESEIVTDYFTHISEIDQKVESYRTLPLKKWSPESWSGFFTMLQSRLSEPVEWDYVPNRSGGFMGCWWKWEEGNPCYLQLEEEKLCFKLEVKEKQQQSPEWDKWHDAAMAAGEKLGLSFVRPARKSVGNWMTVAYHSEFRQADVEGKLDFEATVEVLKKAELVLTEAIQIGIVNAEKN